MFEYNCRCFSISSWFSLLLVHHMLSASSKFSQRSAAPSNRLLGSSASQAISDLQRVFLGRQDGSERKSEWGGTYKNIVASNTVYTVAENNQK